MNHHYAKLDEAETVSLSEHVLAAIVPCVAASGTREYRFKDSLTQRLFEIRRDVGTTEQGRTQTQFFMSEFVPNGRACETRDGGLPRFYDDARIHELEERVGANAFAAALSTLGLTLDELVLTGGGYCVGAVYHDSLAACAQAIAQALVSNTRYRYFEEVSEQERIQRSRQQAVSSHAYWKAQRLQFEAAQAEDGIFKGCSSTLGPLRPRDKHAILAYCNVPSQEAWKRIRGLVITGSGTLWQAWGAHDASVVGFDDGSFPDAEVLREAIRGAVAAREAEIAKKLAASAPRGLRAV